MKVKTRQLSEHGSAAFVELIVDQRDKFCVIVGHRRPLPSLFQLHQRGLAQQRAYS